MDCQFINENIIDYLDDQLSLDNLTKFKAHLKDCQACQELVKEVRLTYRLTEKPQEFRVSESFVEYTMVKLHKPETPIVSMVYQVLKPIAVAASIGLGILIGNGELTVLNSSSEDSQDDVVLLSVSTPADYSVWQSLEEDYGSQD